jgi:hypothetical protein
VTDLDVRPSTATGPTVRSAARSTRGPLLVALAVVLAGVLVGVLAVSGSGGRLDVASYSPGGARAVAELLRARGVQVDRVDSVSGVLAQAGPDATVVLPVPEALADVELEQLAALPTPMLVVAAQQEDLDLLGIDADAGADVGVERRQPACELPAAQLAGEVEIGGTSYEAATGPSVGCYASGGRATLLQLPEQRVTLLGDGSLLTNDQLDEAGHAALALGLLGAGERVLWLVPQPGRAVAGDRPQLSDLLADQVPAGALWLLVLAGVVALWRARQLGRVVEEPLPVVVRAAEAVEGRARLYRAAGARETAAEALRAATRGRVVRRVGLPPGAGQPAVVELVAERSGSDPAVLSALLYGGAPADDPALVRLADDLRTLESSLGPASSSSS